MRLRQRLMLSHILPLLVVFPLAGLALVYLIETQFVVTNLVSELAGQALLVAELTTVEPALWIEPPLAQDFAVRLAPRLGAQLVLLGPGGEILGGSEPPAGIVPAGIADLDAFKQAQDGELSTHIEYSPELGTDLAQVLVPVFDSDQRLVGVVLVSRPLSSLRDRFLRLRYLTGGVVALSLLFGIAAAGYLALRLERPLQELTSSVQRLAARGEWITLREVGPQEIRTLSHAFNQLSTQLREVERARGELLDNLAHELGRPLSALDSAILALQSGALQEPELSRELLTGMRQAIRGLRRLLDDLDQLHDYLMGKLTILLQATQLSEWMPTVLAPWQRAALDKGIDWSSDLPASLPVVQIDPDRMAQVLGNLLSNAIKFTPPGGRVSVSAGESEGRVWIRVQDTGVGIPTEVKDRIFQPFPRSGRSRSFPQGMGLGLNIAHQLVAAHGGAIEFQSGRGAGSTFTVSLPAWEPTSGQPAGNGPSPSRQDPPRS
jgi:signal transduction histidine kinase